jgi:DNA processing protein
VSGLARGIDAAAHQAALETGTIAILAGGLKTIYPPEHKALTALIAQKGLLLSEQPINLRPQAHHFLIRNRLISGLATQIIIVEAALKSGSLLTARNALDQGRDVLAVPGHPLDPRAAGCNVLIRDGAALVRNAQDVLDLRQNVTTSENDKTQLNGAPCQPPVMGGRAADKPAQTSESQLQQDILDRLSVTAISENQLIRRLARPVAECNAAITELELDQKLLRHAGGQLSLRP